jgi:uncharacterized membrane protein YcaP (DUF421 family)
VTDLALTWEEAAVVVVSTIGIYFTLLALLRIAGQRSLANLSSSDFAAVVALGAVTGRVVLAYTPTLLAGMIGLTTLFALRAAVGFARRHPRLDAVLGRSPILLMADGALLLANLRRARVVESEIRSKLRLAGITRYCDVGYLVLERTGAISVLRRDQQIDTEILADVRR